jgi:protein-disulfide isomerase
MRCEDVENDITQYLAGQLPAESTLLEHLAGCSRCRQQTEELRSTWDDLDRLAVPASSPVMNADLLAAIAAAEKIPEIPERRTPLLYFAKPILITFLAMGAAFFVGRSLVESSREPFPGAGSPVNVADRHYRGASGAPVTLLEYGDYQCPPCATYNPVINEVLKKYQDKVRLEFRHFPLTPRHEYAAQAAMAAEAAGQQGHYWEMHDQLLASLQQWSHASNVETEFVSLAASLGLDQAQFLRDLRSPELQQRISNDIASARAAHVAATPTFFLNGHRLDNIPPDADVFAKLIDAELQNGK